MKTIFIGGIFPQECYEHILRNSKGVIQYAADALQKSMLSGLNYHISDIQLINITYIGAYPNRYKKLYIKEYEFSHKTPHGIVYAKNVGFCNLFGWKLYSRYYKLKKTINAILSKSNDKITFIVYALTPPILKACCDIKKKYPQVKIVVIVPDLPEYMSDNTNIVYRIYKGISNYVLQKCYPFVDGWCLLSSHMKERLPIHDNWTVVEGIHNNQPNDISIGAKSSENYILYSGTLAKRYGIQMLVRAFHKSNLTNIKLYICGAGDSQKMIEKYCGFDNRIEYLGQLRREEVLELQKGAMLLVNPRTPEGEYTKFSFPSKTMEYMASGVPVLMHRLQGIPEEYYKYCYTIKGHDEQSLKNSLESVLCRSPKELKEMGRNAREFILKHKDPISQTRKIIQLIETL